MLQVQRLAARTVGRVLGGRSLDAELRVAKEATALIDSSMSIRPRSAPM